MYPHRIRLRAPWESAEVPGGRVARRRKFGLPRTLDPAERVALTCAAAPGLASASLNGVPLPPPADTARPFEYDIKALLRERNEVEFVLTGGGELGEVALEIRAAAVLRGVTVAAAAGAWEVRGSAEGESARPLDLYVLAGGATLAHAAVAPTPGGRPFALAVPRGAGPVRVELVDGGVVWYTVKVPAPADP